MTAFTHECALRFVPLPDGVLHMSGDVPRVGRRLLGRTRFRAPSELLLLQLLDRQVEYAIEHGRELAVRDLVAEQRLDATELIERRLAKAAAEHVTLLRDRLDLRLLLNRHSWPRGRLVFGRWCNGRRIGRRDKFGS